MKKKVTPKRREKASSTKFKVSVKASQGKEDAQQRRKYSRGGRIEAYTFGEALGKGRWP